MKESIFKIIENQKVGKDIYQLILEGDTQDIHHAGQFVEIQLEGYYLRRPISVCYYESNRLVLLYKVLGKGTKELCQYKPGRMLHILTGLGNGYSQENVQKPLLIAGGIGIAPMLQLAIEFHKNGITPILLYGAASKEELVLTNVFSKYTHLLICTDDGSLGYHGNPVDFLKSNSIEFDTYYACGPLVMLKHLVTWNASGFLSLEARMGCGFGACMGCSIQTIHGPQRVCKEGPVFSASEVIFQ